MLGEFASFGFLFNDFLTSIGSGTSAVTTIMGFYALSMSISGLFASSLIKRFSLRSVGIFGAILYTIGSFLSAFVTSVEHLIISFSVFQGKIAEIYLILNNFTYIFNKKHIGFSIGLMFSVGYTNFNHYFVKRRIFMMSVTQVLKGTMASVYPIAARFLVERYGFRGATLIFAAVHAHAIFGMMIQHPVEWHYKTIRVPIEESEPFLVMNSNEKEDEVKITVASEDESKAKVSLEDIEKDDKVTQLIQSERSKSIDTTQKFEGFDPINKRISSIMSLGDLGGAVILEDLTIKNGKWYNLTDLK